MIGADPLAAWMPAAAAALRASPLASRRPTAAVIGPVERLARGMAAGLELRWRDLGADAQAELMTLATEALARIYTGYRLGGAFDA